MKKMNVQRGDAMVILVVVLAVALVGVVGWVAYGKIFSTQDTAEVADTPVKATEETPELAKLQEACAPYEKLCFEYPEGWKIDIGEHSIGQMQAKGDRIILSSPTDSIKMQLDTNRGGIGGVCLPGVYGNNYRVRSQETKLTGYTTSEYDYSDVQAMTLVSSNLDETQFTISVVLSRSRVLIDNEVSSYCDSAFSMFVPSKAPDAGSFYFVAKDISGGANSDGEATSTQYTSLAEAKKVLESEEWKRAFDILASAHYK